MAIERLKRAVRAAGLKQKDLAAALDISEAHVSRILNGNRGITLETALRIVEVLRHHGGKRRGVSLDALFGKAA